MDTHTENLLIKDISHDPEAFGMLFDYYYPMILRYCLRRTGKVSIAEDLTSETFMKAFKKIESYQVRNVRISAWFYAIANNEIKMYFRKNSLSTLSLEALYEEAGYEPLSSQDILEETLEAEREIERNEQFLKAQKILQSMPIKYQEVISLRYFEGKKIKEISQILEKSDGTIKSLISRGVKNLTKKMNEGTNATKIGF